MTYTSKFIVAGEGYKYFKNRLMFKNTLLTFTAMRTQISQDKDLF